MDLYTISAIVVAVLVVIILAVLIWRKRREERLLSKEMPWVLILAFREQDLSSLEKISKSKNDMLLKAERDYTIKPNDILRLIIDTIDMVGRVYHPDEKKPLKQLSLKQINDLLNRIIKQLLGLADTVPFNMLASVDIGTVQFVHDTQKSIRENKLVQGVMDSPIGGFLKSSGLLKWGKSLRTASKMTSTAGILFETGKKLAQEGGKRLLLNRVVAIVSAEATATFSGGEVHSDEQRADTLSLWVAANLIRSDRSIGAGSLEWLQTTACSMKDRPDAFLRFLLLLADNKERNKLKLYKEMLARYRQSRGRLRKAERAVPPEWQNFFTLQSFQAVESLEEPGRFYEQIADFRKTLDPDSSVARKLSGLIPNVVEEAKEPKDIVETTED